MEKEEEGKWKKKGEKGVIKDQPCIGSQGGQNKCDIERRNFNSIAYLSENINCKEGRGGKRTEEV